LQDELQNTKTTPTDQQKTQLQTLAANSINAGKVSTDLNPADVDNWSSRGYVYQNLLSISPDSGTWAISSYDAALKLDPNNPYLFAQEGNVDLASALSLTSDQSDQKNQLLAKAQTQLEKSVSLNPNYSDGLYSLGLVYDALGQIDKSIAEFKLVQQLNPTDKNIQAILDNLNAGKPILQSTTPPTTPPSGTSNAVGNTPSKPVK
jgi:tetratricopeptide (TPR) repeat protein